MMEYQFKLYITGNSPRSKYIITALRDFCDQALDKRYELEVIDVLESPHLAEQEKILATPTLIKYLPKPIRRLIGDLSNRDIVLAGLDMLPASTESGTKATTGPAR